MEILINELSLSGQFVSVDSFVFDSLPSVLSVIKEIDTQKDQLFKKSDFYASLVTAETSLHDILIGALSRRYDEIRKVKSLFSKFFEDPYWEESQRHSVNSSYLFNSTNIWGASLAEAAERDQIVLSFRHDNFSMPVLPVLKDESTIDVDNLLAKGQYKEILWQRRLVPFEAYCKVRFQNSKIDFSQISESDGFNLISKEIENLFLDAFEKFRSLSWALINVDEGLDYKPFKNRNFFRNISHPVHKFRVSRRYRCFGYTNEGIFYVLMFDLEHKLSDQG